MMDGSGFGGMGMGFGVLGIVFWVILILVIAALVKYLFFQNK